MSDQSGRKPTGLDPCDNCGAESVGTDHELDKNLCERCFLLLNTGREATPWVCGDECPDPNCEPGCCAVCCPAKDRTWEAGRQTTPTCPACGFVLSRLHEVEWWCERCPWDGWLPPPRPLGLRVPAVVCRQDYDTQENR